MNIISKLLVATAIVASAAAPAFAVDYNSELQANATATRVQTGNGSDAYAMDNGTWVRTSTGEARGFNQINGGM